MTLFCVTAFMMNHRITAYGAAGGRSVLVMSRSHGVYLTGDFWLKKGEDLYILVGQKGEDACPSVRLILIAICTVTYEPAADQGVTK